MPLAAATTAYDSDDMPDRDSVSDLAAADAFLESDKTALDAVAALGRAGFKDVAENLLEMQRQRVIGDYLHTSAIFDENFNVQSVLNTPNDYSGPGTGYRVEGEVWEAIRKLPQALDPRSLVDEEAADPNIRLDPIGLAPEGRQPEVVIAVGPAFATHMRQNLANLTHSDVLRAITDGITAQEMAWRVVKVFHGADFADVGQTGAQISGFGICIGLHLKNRRSLCLSKSTIPRDCG